ncbi:MAG: methyltransferase domain-containing protein [Bacteroidota bacterium]
MQPTKNIIDCYNKTAISYAEKYIDELKDKHLDIILLKTFAEKNRYKGKMIDLGCGPGQTSRFLADCGITEITGVDISPIMIEVAKKINPSLQFETADMLKLQYDDKSFSSAIAFYSIVHFDYDQLKTAFTEIKRILKNDSQFLFSFHIGDTIVHLDNFLEMNVDIDFYFFDVDRIINILNETGFKIIDVIERHPYAEVEYPSKRAYMLVRC